METVNKHPYESLIWKILVHAVSGLIPDTCAIKSIRKNNDGCWEIGTCFNDVAYVMNTSEMETLLKGETVTRLGIGIGTGSLLVPVYFYIKPTKRRNNTP